MKCPTCSSERTRASRVRIWEAVLLVLLIKPFRCRSCGRRFWRLRFLA